MTPTAWVLLLLASGEAGLCWLLYRRLRDATRMLAEERARREPVGMPRTSSRPPPGPLVTMLLALAACTSTQAPTTAANATRLLGHAAVPTIQKLCTEPYDAASQLPEREAAAEIERIDARGCPEAGRAYDALKAAHEAMWTVVSATKRGECTGAAPVGKCDVIQATNDIVRATTALAGAIDRLEKEAAR